MNRKTSWILFCLLLIGPITLVAQSGAFKSADSYLNANMTDDYLRELYTLKESPNLSGDDRVKLYIRLMEFYRIYKYNEDSLKLYYEEGIDLANTKKDLESQTNLSFMWGDFLTQNGKYVEALEIFQKVEPTILEEDYSFLPHFLDAYARLLYYLKDNEKAFSKLKQEAKIFEKRKHFINMASVYNNLGILYKSSNQLDSSILYHQKSQDINLRLNDTINIIKSYNNLGNTYFAKGLYQKSEDYYKRAYNYAPDQITESLKVNYARLLYIQGKFYEAEELLLQVIQNPEDMLMQKNALQELTQIKQDQGQFREAFEYQQRLNQINEELVNETKVKEIERLKADHLAQQREREIGVLKEKTQTQQKIIVRNKLLGFISLLLALFIVVASFLFWTNRTKGLRIEALKLEQKLLRSQMNPHFIFNALTNIQTNVLKNENDKAVSYLAKFARLLRSNLENSFKNSILLSKEIESITGYLELQNIRFDNRLNFSIWIDESLKDDIVQVPPMFIQPLVENAIEHGISGVENPMITIEFIDKETFIQCVVQDNGVGFGSRLQTKPISQKESLSTKIIKDRLKILSRKTKLVLDYSIEEIKEDVGQVIGTKVLIDLPLMDGTFA